MNKYLQSNTVRLGLLAIIGAAGAYLGGQVDAAGAILLALTGLFQVIQRSIKLSKEPQSPAPPLDDYGPDKGPGV